MPKQNPTLYSISKTFVWFAIVSLILLVSLIGIVMTDYDREWKVWQKKFVQLKTELAKKELKETDEKIDKQKLADLEAKLKEAHAEVKSRQGNAEELEKKSAALDTQIAKAKGSYQNLKQFQDSYRYFFEETRLHNDSKAKSYEAKLKDINPKVDQAKSDLEILEKSKEDIENQLKGFSAKEKELQKEIDKIEDEHKRIARRIEKLKPSLAKTILNAPMVDFIAPSLRVQQVVLEDLYDDYHFAKTQKVDRCMTCHLGIDQKGFENTPQPFRTHPKLDLYLSSSSPHSIEKFGCTVCHGGNGHSVSFTDSAHTPKNEAQEKEWQKKYRWHENENWEPQMLPSNHVQASCAKCHSGTVEAPQADQLNQGRKLAETYGCLNCHKINGSGDFWKVGPDLGHVGSKLDKDWIKRWLENPKNFRPGTKMPRIFHLSNTSSPEDIEKSHAAIQGIAEYLLQNSETVALTVPPANGDAANGEKLVKELGCLGCHAAAGINISSFGPELSNLGSKVKPDWLYSWLKDPKHYSASTRMPNLRLSDKEASDITAYLLSQKNAEFEQSAVPQVKPEAVDALALSFLEGTVRQVEAKAELAKMDDKQKLEFVGKKSIAHQGCFGCHTIKGFEDTKSIGADLSNEGRKDIHQFDFGFVDIEHSRHAWIVQKLKDPRIFDKGKLKAYHEKLRMPQFDLKDEEIDALTTFVLSLTQEQIPLEMHKRLDLKDRQAEHGRFLVAKFNCNGCHELDHKSGALREFVEDKGQAPPVLDGEGAKVQEKWLHDFLHHPVTIRPWLTYRMPTFGFTEEDLNSLVQYMANLSHQEISYRGYPLPETPPEKLAAGKEIFGKFQCAKCHEINADSKALGTSFLAPNLTLTKNRLKPEWVDKWLTDPQVLQPGTMMPTFFSEGQSPITDLLGGDAKEQIEAIRDYLYRYESRADTDSNSKNTVAK